MKKIVTLCFSSLLLLNSPIAVFAADSSIVYNAEPTALINQESSSYSDTESSTSINQESNDNSSVNNKTTTISVWNLFYDPSTKSVIGMTEPNAQVFVRGSNGGQGIWTADNDGKFTCEVAAALPGESLYISTGFNYEFGAPVEFIIPKESVNFTVRNLSYNSSTKSVIGMTEPNAQVFVRGSNGGQGIWTAGNDGKFTCEVAAALPGESLYISTGFNYEFGTPVEFIIPKDIDYEQKEGLPNKQMENSKKQLDPSFETRNNIDVNNNSKTNNLDYQVNSAIDNQLPKTGEIKDNILITMIGAITVVSISIWAVFKIRPHTH